MTVEFLKDEIVALPEEERHSLAVWLNGLDSDDWDHEMERDFAPGGRGLRRLKPILPPENLARLRSIAVTCPR